MNPLKVGLMWHGDREARDNADLAGHRLGPTAEAFRRVGLHPEAVVYNDDFADEVREQLPQLDAVQVWVNPIEQGRGREKLDDLLREAAGRGVLVNTHPDTILKMGTKEVLWNTRTMAWGSDVHVYRTLEDLKRDLPARLGEGRPRVLKQLRGHSGHGVWKITPTDQPGKVLVRHAARGSTEEAKLLDDWIANAESYFENGGFVVDQEFQDRIADGMIRCYQVQGRVQGFGHQEINALFPAAAGAAPEDAPQPGPRLYYPAEETRFQKIRELMEQKWIPEMLQVLGMESKDLPLLWDADFMLGTKDSAGADTYVLCEINVSSVYPYPPSAIDPLAEALKSELELRLHH